MYLPITCDHYLTENAQRIQADRKKASIEAALKEAFGLQEISPGATQMGRFVEVDFSKLVATLVRDAEAAMERQATSEAADYMQAYYRVSDSPSLSLSQIPLRMARIIVYLPLLICLAL